MRVFIYLVKGEGSSAKEICYWSESLDKYYNDEDNNKNSKRMKYKETQWVQLKSNKLEGGPDTDLNAGIIGFRLEIRSRNKKLANNKI